MKDFKTKKINHPKTLSDKLKFYRKKAGVTLAKAESETKVRLKYLLALERGDYANLPEDVYTLGFLAKYAEFLGAPKDDLMELYRAEHGANIDKKVVFKKDFKDRKFFVTSRTLIVSLVILAILGVFGYIIFEVNSFTSAPNLEISSPSTESIINQDKIEIVGKTDQGATLQINDQTIFIDDNGNFKEEVKLQPGLNNIEIKATDRVKKQTIKVIKILAQY